VGKANRGDDVMSDLVVVMKVISENGYGGKVLQAVVAGEEGGSHDGGRVGLNYDRRYLLVTIDWN
jgi:hypothetical protein